MAALHDLTALELAAAVRSGQVGVCELVEHYLDRIERHSATVGAFVTVTAPAARRAAEEAEGVLTEARRRGGVAGLAPLFGLPTALKDLTLTAGVPTKLGSAAFADLVPLVDDHVVRVLREAGTISLGKTNTPELGAPCYTEPDPAIAPPARTPWDLARSAGGSSGGAGAAVGAGLVPLAQGSDGGGSVRIPASVCGLVGVKPSRGRVSTGPMPNVTGLVVNGPLARGVADAAALLDAMAVVPQPGDASWAPALPPGQSFLGHALAGLRGQVAPMRIGRHLANALDAPVHEEVRAGYEHAAALLSALGHDVVEVELPDLDGLFEDFLVIWGTGFAGAPVDPAREQLLRPLTRWLRGVGTATSAVALTGSMAAVQLAATRYQQACAGLDAVLTPTLAQPPALVGGLRDDADPAGDFDRQARFTPYTAMVNVSGQPAVSVPLHWTPAGLPIGIQLIGRPGDEATVLRLAGQLEAAEPWAGRHPEIW